MNILVLGGTRFLGRHFVEAALARGDTVTLFHRGKSANPFGGQVQVRIGERDPDSGDGLTRLATGTWDVVLDTSGYIPRHVAASVALLQGRVSHYVFVSSVSVYADVSHPGVDERAAVLALKNPDSVDIPADYGALKAACETVVLNAFGKHALIVRPGLIVGPYDPTDRFAYWAARFGAPMLLGERGPVAILPGPPSRPIQCIDARDLVHWILLALQAQRGGVYNVTSPPELWSMGSLAEAGRHLSVTRGFDIAVRWVDDALLVARDVVPWTMLPLWIPNSDPDYRGFQAIDVSRAVEVGLNNRPLLDTLTDALESLITHPTEGRWQQVLSAGLETELAALSPLIPP